MIDTKDPQIINRIESLFDSTSENLKDIDIKSNNLIDLNILNCACFEEIINHITLFDDNINDINLHQILNDNYCLRYRERKYISILNYLKKNKITVIKHKMDSKNPFYKKDLSNRLKNPENDGNCSKRF